MLLYVALGVVAVGTLVLIVRAMSGGRPDPRKMRDELGLFAVGRDPFAKKAPPSGNPFGAGFDPASVPDADEALHAEVATLLARGLKINAIKLYRERTGAGLADAKNVVEAWAVSRGAAPAGPPPARERSKALPIEARPALLAEIASVAQRDGLIPAIKRWRVATGAGLAASKALVEAVVAGGPDGVPGDLVLAAWPSDDVRPDAPEPSPQAPAAHERFEPEPIGDDARRSLLAECAAQARGGDKIGAIKRYRERTGLGLKDAKDAVEQAM